MARPRKPAGSKSGHGESETERKEQQEREAFYGGGFEDIDSPSETLNERGKKYYLYILGKMRASNVLTDLDKPILTQTAECLSMMDEATEDIHKRGVTYETIDNKGMSVVKENPSVGVHNKYLTQFNKLGSQLGMSPSSRAQITSVNIDEAMEKADPIKQILGS